MEYERKSPRRPYFAQGLPSLFKVCVREKSERAGAEVFGSELDAARELLQAPRLVLNAGYKARPRRNGVLLTVGEGGSCDQLRRLVPRHFDRAAAALRPLLL